MILSIIFDVANFSTFSLKLKYKTVNNTDSYFVEYILHLNLFLPFLIFFIFIDRYFELLKTIISSANLIIKLIYYISQILKN